jgi:hypothetical protein
MRSTYIAMALCVGFAVPVALGAPAFAYQDAGTGTPVAPRIITLSDPTTNVQDGDASQIDPFSIRVQIDAVMFNSNLTNEEVQEQIAVLIEGSPDPVATSNLVIASVARAPAARRAAIGAGLAQAVNTLIDTQPEIASAIQTAVAIDAPRDVQESYANTTAQIVESAAGGNIGGPVPVPDAPPAPDDAPNDDSGAPINNPPSNNDGGLPQAPEPNPAQAGSPT